MSPARPSYWEPQLVGSQDALFSHPRSRNVGQGGHPPCCSAASCSTGGSSAFSAGKRLKSTSRKSRELLQGTEQREPVRQRRREPPSPSPCCSGHKAHLDRGRTQMCQPGWTSSSAGLLWGLGGGGTPERPRAEGPRKRGCPGPATSWTRSPPGSPAWLSAAGSACRAGWGCTTGSCRPPRRSTGRPGRTTAAEGRRRGMSACPAGSPLPGETRGGEP